MDKAIQAEQMRNGAGFVAALDQSGGSTPKTLDLYGIGAETYSSNAEMFNLIHAMRTRIAMSPAFTGEKVIGAILFEMTMDRQIGGKPTADFLWEERRIVPFLKVDKGLLDEVNGVRLMKPMDELGQVLKKALAKNIFGTKMRSVINAANSEGIAANVAQQFEVGKEIRSHGLVPILEPEVTISIQDKADAEDILRDEISRHLDSLSEGEDVMLKLTLPSADNFYRKFVEHPRVMRVVALSGGYSRADANAKLARNAGMVASFSRALTEGLSVNQSDDEFNKTLTETINSIYEASAKG